MDKHLLSIKKTKTLVSFKAPMQWRLQGLEQGRHELEMFQHWVLLTWWHRSHPKCPRGSLVFKELQNGSKPTWHVLLKSIALSHASCVGLHGVIDKLHSVSVVSHGIDPSPRQTTKKCNSKIWLEDPTPKRTLPKWCRCLPGSHFGKSYRFKLKKKKIGVQQTCMSICCWAPQWKDLLSLFLSLLRGQKREKGINALKLGNTFLTPGSVCTIYLRMKLITYHTLAMQEQLVAELPWW